MEVKNLYLPCEDGAETLVFRKYIFGDGDISFDIGVEDAYCGCNCMGITNRFKRAWHAFFAKPISYSSIYCEDKNKLKRFLSDCLTCIEE